MADNRKGLNCTLSYAFNGTTRTYRVRAEVISHGVVMIASESSGRNRRAYYPHRLAPAQFAIQPILIGPSERESFSNWMQGYADFIMDPGKAGVVPSMQVMVAVRGFQREGVPLQGMEWGDKLGSMVWKPTVVFETTKEPQDTETFTTSKVTTLGGDPDMRYFWPTGIQLGGNSAPSGGYTTVIAPQGSGSDIGEVDVNLGIAQGRKNALEDQLRYGY